MKHTYKKTFILVTALSIIFCNVFAGSIDNAKVVRIRTDVTGKAMIFFNKTISNQPSCVHPSYATALAIDTKTAGGKSALSVALTAKVTAVKVRAYALGSCNIFGINTAEDLNYLEIF